MSDLEPVVAERTASGAFIAAVVIAFLMGVGALGWCVALQSRLSANESAFEQKLADADKRDATLAEQLDATNARLRATADTLGQNVGATQKQIDARTAVIIAEQKKQNAEAARLAEAQKNSEQQIGAVSSDVAGVKTDVGGVKTDVANTQSDLNATKTQLQRVMGDAGVMSGEIATTHSELVELEHKGDRTYLEFTLQKGAKPTLLATIKLQLKKVDAKHARYSLTVDADDRSIEKKDKTLDEPVQFYTGKDPILYELVVNTIDKNKVSGYLSMPKNVQQASSATTATP